MDGASSTIVATELQAAWISVEPLTAVLQLPLRSQIWRGMSGNWAGAGIGSSIDFQDHRQYLPGDDPRYIDWNAYARTGNYSMKLYREEVSPQLDLLLDTSGSMWAEASKRARVLELLMFCCASGTQAGASVRVYFLADRGVKPVPTDIVRAFRAEITSVEVGDRTIPRLEEVPWRQGALRVWISDLLFPGDPAAILASLAHSKGRGLVLAPFSHSESDPDWLGNLEMESSEARGKIRSQRFEPGLLARYRKRYLDHFSLWRDSARRIAVRFARVPAELGLKEAMHYDAIAAGAVEFRS